MSETKYGVLIGRVKEIEADLAGEKSPHYMIVVEISKEEVFNAAINCQSNNDQNPRVLYYADENCKTEITNNLKNMEPGFYEINYADNKNSNIAVDYIRRNLVSKGDMKPLPYDIKGENDLKGFIDRNMKKALNNDNVLVYVFGTYFIGSNGQGIHNIHMNQGNRDKHYEENQIYQDGCFYMYFTEEERWIAYYLAFQNQSWNTDEKGNPQD